MLLGSRCAPFAVKEMIMLAARAALAPLFAALVAFGAFGASAPAQEVGTVTRVQGSAVAQRADEVMRLAPEVSVIRDDTVATGERSRLEVLLRDDSTLTLGENGRLVLDELIVGSGETTLRMSVSGAFRLASAALRHTRDSEITTPLATIGIRGTELWGGPIDGAYGVFLIEGEISVSTEIGTVVLDTPGTGTTLRAADAPPSVPVTWPQTKVDRAVAAVSFRTP